MLQKPRPNEAIYCTNSNKAIYVNKGPGIKKYLNFPLKVKPSGSLSALGLLLGVRRSHGGASLYEESEL